MLEFIAPESLIWSNFYKKFAFTKQYVHHFGVLTVKWCKDTNLIMHHKKNIQEILQPRKAGFH